MSGTFLATLAGLALAITLALPALGGEPPDISALQAAEAEASPRLPAPQSVELPILVYHHVVPGRSGGPDLARALFVTPEAFEQQLKYLSDNSYQSVSFDALADCLEYGVPLPARAVILSFDDGWENQFAYAFPLLQKYRFTATFFVVTNYLDRPNFMTTDQLRTLLAAGMTIGSHTRSHPALPTIGNPHRLADEIAGSKAWLEEQLGVAIDAFAYPYGAYTAVTATLVKEAGYRTARTVDRGTHAAVDTIATLPAILFPAYLSHYRAALELAANR